VDSRLSSPVVLLCPVRGCRRPLAQGERRLTCPRGHSFDVARSGYVNLLQPQDRRSPRAGDPVAVRQARGRLIERGLETPITEALVNLLHVGRADAVLDAGCGDGHHLAALASRSGSEGHGLDISTAAIDEAARRYPDLHWVVANADRFLPYAAASFRAVTSITARRNPEEFRRVLRPDGVLLLVVPAPDDLIEVREAILGEGRARDRVATAIETFAPVFTLERHERIRHVAHLDAAALADLMTGSYRGGRASRQARLATVGALDVTLSRDALLFRPARRGPARDRASG